MLSGTYSNFTLSAAVLQILNYQNHCYISNFCSSSGCKVVTLCCNLHFPFEFTFENLFIYMLLIQFGFLWIVSLYVYTLLIRFPFFFLLLLLTFKSSFYVTMCSGITKYFLLFCHLSGNHVYDVLYCKEILNFEGLMCSF